MIGWPSITTTPAIPIHIVIKEKAQDRKDLIIAKDYITHGIRQRASELLTIELGPENEFDQKLKLVRQVEVDKFTPLDRSILKHMEQGFLVVSAMPPSDPSHTLLISGACVISKTLAWWKSGKRGSGRLIPI